MKEEPNASGHEIFSTQSKEVADSDDVENAKIRPLLQISGFYRSTFDVLDSTQSRAREIVYGNGLPSDMIMWGIRAEHQTAGRGRLNRLWIDQDKSSLLLTLIIDATAVFPSSDQHDLASIFMSWIPLIAADCVRQGLEKILKKYDARPQTHVEPVLKWPNDVLMWDRNAQRYKKIAGIIVEKPEAHQNIFLVGQGINIDYSSSDLPDVNSISLRQLMSELPPQARDILEIEIYKAWNRWVTDLTTDLASSEEDIFNRVLSIKDKIIGTMVTLGKKVHIEHADGQTRIAYADDLAADGALIVTDESGQRHTIYVGDIVHIPFES